MAKRIWWVWLMVVSVGTGAFGLAFIVLPEVMVALFDGLVLAGTGIDARFGAEAAAYIRFSYGVLGAVMTGWAVSMVFVLFVPFRRGERYAWGAIALSVLIWYAVDTPFSLLSGYAGNAALNTVFVMAFAVPLAATFRTFFPRTA